MRLRTDYPGIYTSDGGFYDAVNPVTGAIGHRRLVLDQSMIIDPGVARVSRDPPPVSGGDDSG